MPPTPGRITSRTREHLRGLNEIDRRAGARARAGRRPGRLAARRWTSPPTSPWSRTPSTQPLRRAFYEAWTTRASDQGPNAGALGQRAGDGEHPAPAARSRAAARLRATTPTTRWPRAWRAASTKCCSSCAQLARSARAAAQQGIRRARSVRGPQARSVGRRLLLRTPAARAVTRSRRKSCGPTSRCRTC